MIGGAGAGEDEFAGADGGGAGVGVGALEDHGPGADIGNSSGSGSGNIPADRQGIVDAGEEVEEAGTRFSDGDVTAVGGGEGGGRAVVDHAASCCRPRY